MLLQLWSNVKPTIVEALVCLRWASTELPVNKNHHNHLPEQLLPHAVIRTWPRAYVLLLIAIVLVNDYPGRQATC